jgi:hypothetical protein
MKRFLVQQIIEWSDISSSSSSSFFCPFWIWPKKKKKLTIVEFASGISKLAKWDFNRYEPNWLYWEHRWRQQTTCSELRVRSQNWVVLWCSQYTYHLLQQLGLRCWAAIIFAPVVHPLQKTKGWWEQNTLVGWEFVGFRVCCLNLNSWLPDIIRMCFMTHPSFVVLITII